jgi:hypothetical protein
VHYVLLSLILASLVLLAGQRIMGINVDTCRR